jgi:hypothetical protein
MKAIILISSIFYLLGLKIGHKLDITKSSDSVDKIISVEKTSLQEKANSISLKDGLNLIDSKDSIQKSGITTNHFLRSK